MKERNIGDAVWTVMSKHHRVQVECPDCCGKKFLTVTYGDGATATIDCVGCALGFEPSRGFLTVDKFHWRPTETVVNRKELKSNGVMEYGARDRYDITDHMYDTQEEAEAACKKLEADKTEEEKQRMRAKDCHKRSWSWNAHYHRQEIKRHESDLAYHKSKLEVAKQHVKKEQQVKQHVKENNK